MSAHGYDKKEDRPTEAPEGAFDAQLTFPAPFAEAPTPLQTIIKRDGREVPFEKAKIAEAIFKAASSIGGQDRARADGLANGVAIYLTKVLHGRPPTVDEVHDAVEKVLIEMGHARTALAYARYRDKRARMRQLRAGNLRALLKELAEAAGEAPVPPPSGESLSVRTSGQSVVSWDRTKIVEALVRETELDERVASVVALDVEKQILSAGVQTLTAALIRELVDAKLVELGLEEHRRRHMRLGVPLYDAERILCVPNGGPGPQALDPETTNGVLAEQVKREYALSRVFSQAVADAHLRGDLHLHHLGAIDRFHSLVPALEYVKQFGGAPGARPPRDLENLLAQLAHFTAGLQHHVSETVCWEGLNYYLAPFLPSTDEGLLRSAARMVVFLLGHGESAPGRAAARVELGLSWELPAGLRRKDAIGPGGKPVGRTYAECAHAAQGLAWALLSAHAEAAEESGRPLRVSPVVRVTHELFRMEGHEDFLARAAEAAPAGGMHFLLDRSVLPERERERAWTPWRVSAHEVSLNLPRLAYQAGDEGAMRERLANALDMAVRAHREKQAFLRKLLALGEVGPLALLAQHREGLPYVNPERAACLVGVAGLNECVRRLSGGWLHGDEEALALGVRLMEHLRVLCDRRSEREGFPVVPVCGADARVAERLAALDLRRFPEETRATLDADLWTDDVRYTPGAGVAAWADADPLQRARCEGQFHDWAEPTSPTILQMPEDGASSTSIVGFLQKAFFQTSNARIAFGR